MTGRAVLWFACAVIFFGVMAFALYETVLLIEGFARLLSSPQRLVLR